MGLEIRPKAVEYVQDRIDKLRKREQGYNISVVQTNAMKYLPNYFKKGQVRDLIQFISQRKYYIPLKMVNNNIIDLLFCQYLIFTDFCPCSSYRKCSFCSKTRISRRKTKSEELSARHY